MTDTTIVTKDILAERRRKRRLMGKYINIGNDGFRKAREGEYVDKSMLINFINSTLGTEQCMTCVTRARRFGKSMAAKMLSAYYDQSCDSRALFADLKVASEQSFDKHLNRYPVIYLDMTYFLTMCPEGKSVVTYLEDELKQDLWLRGEANVVADAVDKVHEENTSVLQYNDENALASVLSLAFYAARGWYTIVRELPAGLGFADIVMIPKRGVDRPAMVLELKWNKTADSAIRQMKEKRYAGVLKDFAKEILLVGINYSKKTKKHECVIENIQGVFSRSKAENSRSKERKSRSEKVRMIKEFCSMAPRSLEDIAAIVGSKDKYYMKRTLLDPLLGKELFMTEPESPNSPKQRYYC